MNNLDFLPIGYLESPYQEVFGVPRQAGLTNVTVQLKLEPAYQNADYWRGLESFSHVWLQWIFHHKSQTGIKPLVRPPRLGGNTSLGVFSTRSPYRPNGLGLSAVKLEDIIRESGKVLALKLSGADCVDGTPVVDVKPYLPYCDSLPDAKAGFAHTAPDATLGVAIADNAREAFASIPDALRDTLERTLALDPRPAYQVDPKRDYGLHFAQWDIGFRVANKRITVTRVEQRLSS